MLFWLHINHNLIRFFYYFLLNVDWFDSLNFDLIPFIWLILIIFVLILDFILVSDFIYMDHVNSHNFGLTLSFWFWLWWLSCNNNFFLATSQQFWLSYSWGRSTFFYFLFLTCAYYFFWPVFTFWLVIAPNFMGFLRTLNEIKSM